MKLRVFPWVCCAALVTPGLWAAAAEGANDMTMSHRVGGWTVRFEGPGSRLTCVHEESGAEVGGALSFEAETRDGWKAWSVVLPRDSVAARLALLDHDGNVQGYVTFAGAGDVLRVTAAHRAAQSYRGRLAFDGICEFGTQAFACRTRAPESARVVQMAAGPADSRLNDSLFDIPSDTALRFGGRNVSITADASAAGRRFGVALDAEPHVAAHAALEFEAIRDYYRARYVPHYRPIDRERCPSPPTGWMSWNTYFDTAGEKENLDEARVGAEYLKPFGMEIWSIESWQDNSDTLPVSKFHNLTLRPNPRQFPSGMKWLADRIRELGFRPGIWTVPYGTGDAEFYEAHKDWFLHDADGHPMRNWNGLYVLDPSQEAVRNHMEETHRVMSEEWGYEYFKIDGMSGRGPSYSAHFYERDDVRAAFREPCEDPFRLCVEALRRGIGEDRIWLACQGHYTGSEIGFADAGRIGADIVHPNKPPEWDNFRNQAWTTLNQLFVHNIVWYGDPDTLLVGAPPLETARLATTVVALPGQMMFAGDKLAELPAERMRLLQQSLPVCDVRPLDLFPVFEMAPVWDLKVRRPFAEWDVVSLFNWDETAAALGFEFAELGLASDVEYLVYDFWSQRYLGAHTGGFSAEVAPHANLLLAVHPSTGRPQFLSTDRHVTQGATCLRALDWNDGERTLTGAVDLVGGHPSRLAFYVPEGFEPAQTVVEEGELAATDFSVSDRLLTLTLVRPDSGVARWRVQF